MFENLDDPRKQALLALAAGLFSPVRGKGWSGFGEAMGQGINAGLLGLNQATRTQEAVKRGEMERKLEQARLAEFERGQKFNQVAFRPGIGAQPATPVDDNGYPMPSPEPTFDYAAAAAVDPMKAWQLKQQMGQKPKPLVVGDTLVDPTTYQPLYRAPQQAPKPKYQAGDTQELKVGRFIVTREMQGDGKWKEIARSAMDKPESGDGLGKPSPGYRWKSDGTLEPIPGGPADTKAGKEAEALKKREQGALSRADSVIEATKQALDKVGYLTAGTGSIGLRNIPGTDAYNLIKKVDEIKANIGFQELQAMREASPTGGALGQVAVQELNMLQSVLGSLDTGQSPDQLTSALNKVHKHFTNWKQAVRQAREAPQGEQSDPLGIR